MAEEVGLYQFIPDANSCDICESMAGTYEDAPEVPVHPYCNCQVVAVAHDDDNCEYEVVYLEMDEEDYTETQSLPEPVTLDSPLAEDAEVSITVHLGVEEASFDEGVLEAVEEKFGWAPHEFDVIISQTVPAGTKAVDADVDFRMKNTIYTADRRRTCYSDNADGSITADIEDIGSIGGITIERADVDSFEIYPTEFGDQADFFSSPDESPY